MNKKLISLILCVVMLVSVFTACAGGESTTTTAAPAGETTTEGGSDDTTEPTESSVDFAGEELSILVSQGWMDNHYDGIIARFEEEYSVTVDLQTIPADQYEDLLQSKLTSGTATDIFWIQ